MARVEAANRARQRVRLQAGAVDHTGGADRGRRAATHLDDEAAVARFDRLDRRMERTHRAVALGVALNRQHQLVTIDDARLRREHGLHTFERGLERLRLVAVDPHQV